MIKNSFPFMVYGVIYQNEATASLISTMSLGVTTTVTIDLRSRSNVTVGSDTSYNGNHGYHDNRGYHVLLPQTGFWGVLWGSWVDPLSKGR